MKKFFVPLDVLVHTSQVIEAENADIAFMNAINNLYNRVVDLNKEDIYVHSDMADEIHEINIETDKVCSIN